jgi:zinc/manganese transport system permease protein
VFTTLIVPALATHWMSESRLTVCYTLGACGYGLGLAVSAVLDLPSGAVIVWTLALLATPVFAWGVKDSAGRL